MSLGTTGRALEFGSLSRTLLRIALLPAALLVWWDSHAPRTADPIAVIVQGAPRSVRQKIGTIDHVTTTEAPARLVLATHPGRDGRVLFYAGRATSPSGDYVLVVDSSGTVLAFDDHFRAHPFSLETGTRHLTDVATAPKGGLWGADVAGDILRFDSAGHLVSVQHSDFGSPRLASDPTERQVWAARSPEGVRFRLPDSTTPLLVRFDIGSGPGVGIGSAVVPEHGLLVDLDNAGDLVADSGVIFYAPFLRDEVIALTRDGDTLWVAHRGLPQAGGEPRFEVHARQATIDYHPVNLGITLGPDGNVYVLSAPGFSTTTSRLDVFAPRTGELLRSVALPTALPTLVAGMDGRVALLDQMDLLTGTAPALRPVAPEISLPLLGGGRFDLAGQRGRVVLFNTWASWCGPCRAEMPALAALAAQFDTANFAFVAVSEDQDTVAAAKFLADLHLHPVTALGRGEMQPILHYPGLPYTILVDRDGRVIQTMIGQLDEARISLLGKVIAAEIGRSPDLMTAHGHHMAGMVH